MPDPFIGEIIMFGGNFAPRGWALCDGSLLSISENQALFSILGTTYGGDGRTTFGLPDLRGRMAMHPGSGPGLTPRRLGEKQGEESVTLKVSEMPAHNHPFDASSLQVQAHASSHTATADTPNDQVVLAKPEQPIYTDADHNAQLRPGTATGGTVENNGGNGAHDNMPPFQCVNFIISLTGVYPSRN